MSECQAEPTNSAEQETYVKELTECSEFMSFLRGMWECRNSDEIFTTFDILRNYLQKNTQLQATKLYLLAFKSIENNIMTIQDIIQGCKKADRRAQRLLYDTYANKYFKVAMRYLKQREDAEDCIEESFVKIFHNILSFQYQELNSFEVWMKRIIVNEALMLLRKRNKFDFISINETPENQTITTDFDNIDVQKIITLIETLPDGYRTVFNLYAIEGYDHSEIAGMLHISESTSKSQLFKARRMLKVKLEKILNITQL